MYETKLFLFFSFLQCEPLEPLEHLEKQHNRCPGRRKTSKIILEIFFMFLHVGEG